MLQALSMYMAKVKDHSHVDFSVFHVKTTYLESTYMY